VKTCPEKEWDPDHVTFLFDSLSLTINTAFQFNITEIESSSMHR